MREYVFKRKQNGKEATVWSGRYSLGRKEKTREVALGLTDYPAAVAKLHQIVIEAQREAYGLIPKKSLRTTAAASLGDLLAEYKADLTARQCAPTLVVESTNRIARIFKATKWTRLSDITAESFITWRASQTDYAPKTLKEYQTSLNAFLNWLINANRLEESPLSKLTMPEIRGKQVRPSRPYTLPELAALFTAAKNTEHRLAYMMLAYMGQRTKEIALLAWGDVHLDENPYILIRETTTKDFKKRAIPLHPRLAEEVKAFRPADAAADAFVFSDFPTWEAAWKLSSVRASLKRTRRTARYTCTRFARHLSRLAH